MQLLLLSEAERPRLGRIPAESSIRRTPSWPEPSMAVSAALPEAHSEKANVVAIDSSSKSPCGLSGVAEVFLPRPTPDRRLDRSFGGLAFPGGPRLPSRTRYSSAPRLYLRMRSAFEPSLRRRNGCLGTFPPSAPCFREARFASPVAFNLHEFFEGVVLTRPVYPTFSRGPFRLMMFGNEATPFCLIDSAEFRGMSGLVKAGGRADTTSKFRKREDSPPKIRARFLTFRFIRPATPSRYPARLRLVRKDGTSATNGGFLLRE